MQPLILFSFKNNFIKYSSLAFIFFVAGCSTLQHISKIESKSNPSLCFSLIYKAQSVSNSYLKLLLEEASRRDLNCELIAQEILDFKSTITGSSQFNFVSSESGSSPPAEIVHPGTGQTPK